MRDSTSIHVSVNDPISLLVLGIFHYIPVCMYVYIYICKHTHMHTHTHLFFSYRHLDILLIPCHYDLPQGIQYSSLFYSVGRCLLSILHVVDCIYQSQTLKPSLLTSPLATMSLFSVSLSVFLFCR